MKSKKAFEDIRNKPAADLKKSLAEEKDRLWTLKSDLAAGKVKNVREIHSIKRMIARIETLLTSHQAK